MVKCRGASFESVIGKKIQSDGSRSIMVRFTSFLAQINVRIETNRVRMDLGKVRFI